MRTTLVALLGVCSLGLATTGVASARITADTARRRTGSGTSPSPTRAPMPSSRA